MLKDVIKLTATIYNQIFDESHIPLSAIRLYDSYRTLGEVIENTHLVAVHYLALRFDEECLQGSSLGEPIDKWRYFLNEDLEKLNKAVKNHLLKLQYLGIKDPENEDYRIMLLDNLFHVKGYYGYVRDHYNVGSLNLAANHIACRTLVEQYDPESLYILKSKQIDVSTYEKRCELKALLLRRIEKLNVLKQKLSEYLQKHYRIEDLL